MSMTPALRALYEQARLKEQEARAKLETFCNAMAAMHDEIAALPEVKAVMAKHEPEIQRLKAESESLRDEAQRLNQTAYDAGLEESIERQQEREERRRKKPKG